MSEHDTGEHAKCHCSHVTVVIRDMGRIERLCWIMATGIAGLIFAYGASLNWSRLRDPPPSTSHNERTFPDRVEPSE